MTVLPKVDRGIWYCTIIHSIGLGRQEFLVRDNHGQFVPVPAVTTVITIEKYNRCVLQP